MLILSLFPGIDLLGFAFELEWPEACIIRGPDPIFGSLSDIRKFHPPRGVFSGIFGGPPCQAFSRLAHMVRASGREPKFGNLIPEFERCVVEAEPDWFLMENVPDAPLPSVEGYATWSCLLNNRQCLDENGRPATQNRVRRWTFGFRGERRVLMVDTAALENHVYEYAACGGSTGSSLGAAGWDGGKSERRKMRALRGGRSALPWNAKGTSALREICRKQGLPDDFDIPPFTVAAKCKAVANGVPIPMARAIARAVKEAVCGESGINQ